MRSLPAGSGFVVELLEDTSDTHLSRTLANATPATAGKPSLAVFVNNLGEKAAISSGRKIRCTTASVLENAGRAPRQRNRASARCGGPGCLVSLGVAL